MIDQLIDRVKNMYHQLERDEARLDRRQTENMYFGIMPEEPIGAEPEELMDETSPSPAAAPPASAPPEVPESLLDVIGRTRVPAPTKRKGPIDHELDPHILG